MVRDVGARRGAGAGRAGRRARAVAGVGHPRQARRLADGRRQAPRHRPLPPRQADRAQARRSSATSWRPSGDGAAPDLDAALDDDIGDDLLRLIFTACHPVLPTEARVALTLRLLGGLTTEEIARAFLVPEPTIAQRIVRAKTHPGRQAQSPSRCRAAPSWRRAPRLGAGGHLPDLQRGLLGDRRRRLDAPAALRGGAAPRPHPGRARAERAGGARPRRADGDPGLAPAGAHRALGRAHPAARPEPRALGPAADPPRPRRAGARRSDSAGSERPDPTRCRPRSPPAMPGPARPRKPTGRASSASTRRWRKLAPSPVVELNRAVARGDGVRARRRVWSSSTRCRRSRRCEGYHLLPSVRGDLLHKLGRLDEARARVRARRLAHPQRARARPAARPRRGVCRRVETLADPSVFPDS